VAAAALVAALLIAQQVAARALRDALFLSAYPVTALPGMMLAAALLSVAGSLAFAGTMARRSPSAVLTGALASSALLFALEWRLAGSHPRAVAAALYVQLALLGPGIVSAFWSLVNERFDPHSARRVVGRIGSGAALGGVAGGALAWAGAHLVPVPALLGGLTATSLLAVLAVARLRSVDGPEPAAAETGRRLLAGLRFVHEFPYLRHLAGLIALGAFTDALLDYLLKTAAAASVAGREELARFFSLFYGGVALLTLAVQATLARRSLLRVGLAGTVAWQPAAVGLAAGAGLAVASLASAVAARGAGAVLRDSLFRSAYELFYTPLPPWRKRPAKALVDGAADKLGSGIGAGVVLLLAGLPLFSPRWLWLSALLATLASLLLTRRLHHGYVLALEQSLRSGRVAIEADQEVDATTRLTLTRVALDRQSLLAEIRALHGDAEETPASASVDRFVELARDLRSGEPDLIRAALATLRPPDPALTPLLVTLLASDDVFPEVLRALRSLAPRATGQLIDALVDPDQPAAVRQRIPRVLKACPTARAVDGLVVGLDDPDFSVRLACGRVLAWLRERHDGLALEAGRVHAAVARELAAAAEEPEAQLDHVFLLLSLVGERDVLRVSRWALRGEDARLRGTALEYLEQVLPDGVRQPLLRRLGTPSAAVSPRRLDDVEAELRRSASSLPRHAIARHRRSPSAGT
jgi:hypothetical protein